MESVDLPDELARQLGKAHHATGGIDAATNCCWVFTRASLSVWQYGGTQHGLLTRSLPYVPSGAHFVSLMVQDPGKPLRQLAVSLCSQDGNLSIWHDFGDAQADGFQIRVPNSVTASVMASSGASHGRTFLAVLGTADGHLHLVQVRADHLGGRGHGESRLVISCLRPALAVTQPGKLSAIAANMPRAASATACPTHARLETGAPTACLCRPE